MKKLNYIKICILSLSLFKKLIWVVLIFCYIVIDFNVNLYCLIKVRIKKKISYKV